MHEPAVPPEDQERVAAQLKTWRERLIDLTRRNPLLGLSRSRTTKLRVTMPTASIIFDRVALDGKKLRLPLVTRRSGPAPTRTDAEGEEAPAWEVLPGDLAFDAEPADTLRRLRRIRNNARTTVEERGVTTLHLALGALHWTDQYLGDSVAPLWLIPCAVESTRPQDPLLLMATDEDPLLNPALSLYLRERFQRVLPQIPEEPETGVIDRLLSEVKGIADRDWHVSDEVWLSTFSFETLAIYHDLGALADTAASSDIVRAFAGCRVRVDGSEGLGGELDAMTMPDPVPVPVLPTDSSQLDALVQARSGRHLVVYGPPGTGKSQTITNLIGDALGQGKTVLFVSAKMAALEVVYDRLNRLGFGRFCLEAHSTKAGKARIIDELRHTLEAATRSVGADHQGELARYISLRQTLNEAVRELHQRREGLGHSIYKGIGEYARRADLPAVDAPLPWPNPASVTSGQLQALLDLLSDLQAQAAVFAGRDSHPWRACQSMDPGISAREAAGRAVVTVATTARAVLSASPLLEPFLGALSERSLEDLERGIDAFASLAEATWLPEGWTAANAHLLDQEAELLRTSAAMCRALEAARAGFSERVGGVDPLSARALLSPALEKYRHWYTRLVPAFFVWKREVKEKLGLVDAGFGTLAELALLACSAADSATWLGEHASLLGLVRHASPDVPPASEELDDAANAFSRAARLRRGIAKLGVSVPVPEVREVGEGTRSAAATVLAQLTLTRPALDSPLAALDRLFGQHFSGGLSARQAALGAIAHRCEELQAAQERWSEWALLQETLGRCRKSGLEPFVEALAQQGADRAVESFRRRFWMLWTDAQIASSSALQAFRGPRREELVEEFRVVDAALRKAAITSAVNAAASRAAQINNTPYVARDSQLGILQRELQRRRPRPLRRLFADIPQVLQAIKPCMLMSPVSVSTYLTPGALDFNLVVFDEASQLPPQETIPAILRGRQVVVAGDGNQLPPTSFFSSSLFAEESEEEDKAEVEPLQSLLQECEAAKPLFLPTRLRWHYRSRDERLIAFSNHYFYDGDLITFPSPGSPPDRGVVLRYVEDGVWDRGKSGTNRTEARVAARVVLEQLERHPGRSVGVVALSVNQKEAVEDALEETLASRPDLREMVKAKGSEPFFVKSLENVQGDERDTIVITTGYGPDVHGNVALNFGPLNQEGGWRRLNVLVTRAKYLTVLVTSLKSSQLQGISPENRGARALADFIGYAERDCRLPPEPVRPTTAETNDFEESVAAALRGRGLTLDEQVGASSYRIDLAVRDPRNPDWYLLGIECDGATYHSSRTARDRDLLRAEVLRGMGWRLHRIWSIDWFRNPQETTAAAIRAVERAMAQGGPESGVPAPPTGTPATPGGRGGGGQPSTTPVPVQGPKHPGGTVYCAAGQVVGNPNLLINPAGWVLRNRTLLLDSGEQHGLAAEIARVVGIESPIHQGMLLERLKDLHGVARAGSGVKGNFNRGLDIALSSKGLRRDEKGFIWDPGKPLTAFRVPSPGGSPRPIEWIAYGEIRLGVLHVVESQFGLPREALVREAAKALGFGHVTGAVADRVGEVVDRLVDTQELKLSGFQIALP